MTTYFLGRLLLLLVNVAKLIFHPGAKVDGFVVLGGLVVVHLEL